MRTLFLFFILWGLNDLHAQHPMKIEQELLSQFRKIHYWRFYSGTDHETDRYDSLERANDTFRKSLLFHTSTSSATITFDFNELVKEGLSITTSENGLFRIYAWDTYTGGTEHIFDAIYQYKIKNKVFSKIARTNEYDSGRWYSVIHLLKTDNKVYYIGTYHEVHSTRYLYQGVKIFCIENDILNADVRLIKTNTGIRNELGFEFDLASAANRPDFQKLIYFDEDDDQLHLAVVQEDGKVTRQFITYQFTGKYFEQIKKP